MQPLAISAEAANTAREAIMVTGSARSGTTIVGKLVHSLQRVEYAFEPPVFYSLFAMIGDIPELSWKLLYETYLYEEHLLGALAGRTINCNRRDDSSIYKVKDEAEIAARLGESLRKAEAQERQAPVAAFKVPDVVSRVPLFQQYYPHSRIILVHRGYKDTINSLMNRRWFANENANSNLTWPFVVHGGMQIPFWVRAEDRDDWCAMSPVDRCAYYYLSISRDVPLIRNRIDVDYDRMIAAPGETAAALSAALGLSFGSRTQEIIDSIAPTDAERDDGILDQIDSRLRAEILALADKPMPHAA